MSKGMKNRVYGAQGDICASCKQMVYTDDACVIDDKPFHVQCVIDDAEIVITKLAEANKEIERLKEYIERQKHATSIHYADGCAKARLLDKKEDVVWGLKTDNDRLKAALNKAIELIGHRDNSIDDMKLAIGLGEAFIKLHSNHISEELFKEWEGRLYTAEEVLERLESVKHTFLPVSAKGILYQLKEAMD